MKENYGLDYFVKVEYLRDDKSIRSTVFLKSYESRGEAEEAALKGNRSQVEMSDRTGNSSWRYVRYSVATRSEKDNFYKKR